jgi:hypothetical protein
MVATFLLAAITALPVQDGTGMVWGRVRSGTTGAPLAFAVVEIVTPDAVSPIRVQTGPDGVYRLRGIAPGRRIVKATHIDHAPREFEVFVVAERAVSINFDLEVRPVRMPAMVARAVPGVDLRDTVSARPADLGTATARVMEATPGMAELGIADAAREVPGTEPVDPTDVLFVRGGAADLKLVLLNGAPVFAPFHIGGLMQAFDTDLYRSATLFLGGAPARYNGGLSYVMDLETRAGRSNALHGNVAVDMLTAKGMVEGPLADRASLLIAGRGVHGRGTEPFVSDPFPYTYGDAIGRMDMDLGENRVLSVTGFWNREAVQLDSLSRPDQEATWGNTAASVRLRTGGSPGDGMITVAAGRFGARLPVGSGTRRLLSEGTSEQIRVAADFGRTIGPGRLQFGGSFDRVGYDQEVWLQGVDGDSTLFADSTSGMTTGVYVDASVNPLERLQVRAGLRADIFSLDPSIRLAPRVSATVLLTNRVAVTLAAGRYHQYVRTTDEPLALLITPLNATGESQQLTVASASHLTVVLDQDLGEGIRLSLEGFYKSFSNLPSTSAASAEATGIDLWLRRSRGRLNGWFGYSLAWVWSDDDDPVNLRPSLDRQLMTAGLAGPLIGKGKFDVRVSYGAGLPFAAIPEPEAGTPVAVGLVDVPAFSVAAEPVPSIPRAPDEAYLRVDAQIARTWEAEWHGFAFQVTPYVKVLNALNRRDGIFYFYDRGTGADARAIAGLPVLPIIGLDWRF